MISPDKLNLIASNTLSKLIELERIKSLGLNYDDDELNNNFEILKEGYDALLDDESDESIKFKQKYLNLLELQGKPKPQPKSYSDDDNDTNDFNNDHDLPITHLPKAQNQNEQQPSQLFDYNDLMNQQDTYLDGLSNSLQNQYQMSGQMSNELGLHHELLNDLEIGLDDTQHGLNRSHGLLNKFNTKFKSNTSTYIIVIIILILILFILIFKL